MTKRLLAIGCAVVAPFFYPGTPAPAAQEKHEAFGETDVAGLEPTAARLESMADRYDERIEGSWRDWGRFRAVVHRAVREALS